MKNVILLLLLISSWSAIAHEDTFIAFEKSNVHIKLRVGYETSLNINVIESYVEIINDFIRVIDSTEKVFIQFEEDYCFNSDDLVLLAYGDFRYFLLPSGFPFNYNYDMHHINTQKGVNIIIAVSYFKLEPVLQLLEFGLQNKDAVLVKGKNFHNLAQSLFSPEAIPIIDSIMQSESSQLVKKYYSKKVDFKNAPNLLTQNNSKLFLQNDSIFFVDADGSEIFKLSTLYSISHDTQTNGLFLLNTNHSFYFFNHNFKTNQKQYDLPFELSCINRLKIQYSDRDSNYKLEKGGSFVILVDENGNEIIKDWVYFDEINGMTLKK